MDVQLLVYVVGVGLHGGHGHEQLLGDLGRVLFLGQEQQDVRLALGEGCCMTMAEQIWPRE